MKKSPLLFFSAALVVGLGAVVGAQMQTAASLRRQIAQMQSELTLQSQDAIARQGADEKLKIQNAAFQSESVELRKQLTAVRSGAVPTASVEVAAAGAPGEPKAKGNGFMKGIAKMFTDPEMKKAMRSQQAMVVRMMYGDLGRELHLSQEETNQVIELLTDRQMALAARSMGALNEDGAAGNPEELGKSVNASKAEYDEQLKGMLGEERMKKLTEYETGVGDRMQLQQIQQILTSTGTPLEDKQRYGLLDIMKDERAKMPPSVFSPGNKDVGAQVKAMQSEDGAAEMIKITADMNQRVLTRARDVLSPDQLNGFEAAQKQQFEMMQMGWKMMKSMGEK